MVGFLQSADMSQTHTWRLRHIDHDYKTNVYTPETVVLLMIELERIRPVYLF